MKAPPTHRRIVDTPKQSPLNPLQWHVTLECGHGQWLTAKRKPTRQSMYCGHCDRSARSHA